MSGPKVVRIVTREEIVAICRSELARLDAALRAWARIAGQGAGEGADEIAAAHARREELAALIAADRFMDFQKGAGQEIAFLASDSQVRLAKISEERASAQAIARRQNDAARALLGALRAKGVSVPADLASRLERAAKGDNDPSAMAEGFAALSPATDEGVETRRRLASLHRTETAGPSLSDWLSRQPPRADEARLINVDRRLAELQAIGDVDPNLLAAREAAESEPEERRRALLLDSLELDLAGLVAAARTRAALETELNLTLAALGELSKERHEQLEARRAALRPDEALAPLLTEAKAAVDEATKAIAAEARREAVLQALLGLGYEVTEGMETAWADNGQVVLRSASRPDYGLEIAGQAENERLQIRAVAFDDGEAAVADRGRDRDAETIWCGEVGALREQLKRSGTELDILKARAVGEVPLKRVRGGGRTQPPRGAAKPRTRTLG